MNIESVEFGAGMVSLLEEAIGNPETSIEKRGFYQAILAKDEAGIRASLKAIREAANQPVIN